MKPTTESIQAAHLSTACILDIAQDSVIALYAAKRLFETGSPAASVKELNDARDLLVRLRRSQTAALENIDAAISSAKEGA